MIVLHNFLKYHVEYTKSARYRPGTGPGSTTGGSGASSGVVAGRTIAGIPTGTSGHVRASSLGRAQPGKKEQR